MKVHDLLESKNSFGIVVTRSKENNKFEDMSLVTFDQEDIITHKSGHAQNMFSGIVHAIRKSNNWDDAEHMLKKFSKSTKKLGKDFDDAENFHITKYGPFTADELGHLIDKFEK